jgi:hypothetical protein
MVEYIQNMYLACTVHMKIYAAINVFLNFSVEIFHKFVLQGNLPIIELVKVCIISLGIQYFPKIFYI